MWVIFGIGIGIGIGIGTLITLITLGYYLLRGKRLSFTEKTKLISKLLCQFFVVFAVQDLIYAILTESFHNNVTKNKTHLVGLFYDNPLENEWFWLILAVSLTFYCYQVYKTRCRIERDIKNNDLVEKINPIKGLEKLLEFEETSIDELKEKQKEVDDFITNLRERLNELSPQVNAKSEEANQKEKKAKRKRSRRFCLKFTGKIE